MIKGRKAFLGLLSLVLLMALTGAILLRGQPLSLLWANLKHMDPWMLLPGLGMMFGYVGCEALCTRRILGRLGHPVPYRYCLGYSMIGFYVSSITPSATGGQPAQIYYMSRDGIPAAHGALNMMLIASCYQTASLIWSVGVWLTVPSIRRMTKGGLGLLLLYGACMMILLTAGMVLCMFLPGPARRVCGFILKLLTLIHIVRRPEEAQARLERTLNEYREGAECIRGNPGLAAQILVLCLIQQGMLFSVPWTVYRAFGLSGAEWLQVAGLQALLTLAVCNIPLPGAVGPAEGGFVAAFAAIFGEELVTPAMLVSRGISFYAFLAVSFAAAIAVQIRVSRQVRRRILKELSEERGGERVEAVREYLERTDETGAFYKP
ncbi:MAG: flippase-like domain-containing protein [Roseburia sp.]|nr:flippase-like domain-containing protein [Roseburia sp.]MCM1098140.1 flippase-like domain-containing protein [Ruminococcus flavefaciens]